MLNVLTLPPAFHTVTCLDAHTEYMARVKISHKTQGFLFMLLLLCFKICYITTKAFCIFVPTFFIDRKWLLRKATENQTCGKVN